MAQLNFISDFGLLIGFVGNDEPEIRFQKAPGVLRYS